MASWPPESLAADPEVILNECELMELIPARGEGKQFVQVVELATFLYTGEYVHARHVWRRWKDSNPISFLAEWWRVGAAMMSNNPKTIWEGLSHIEANHPAPLSSYAKEVGIAYRKRILQSFPATPPYSALLNFSSPQELEQFCQQYLSSPAVGTSLNNGVQGKTGLTRVVAFLDSATDSVQTRLDMGVEVCGSHGLSTSSWTITVSSAMLHCVFCRGNKKKLPSVRNIRTSRLVIIFFLHNPGCKQGQVDIRSAHKWGFVRASFSGTWRTSRTQFRYQLRRVQHISG
eukprot:scaffold24063_cov157-Cylindrotheca_fusiformis.AAC.3